MIERIAARARLAGLELEAEVLAAIEAHARAVRERNERLKLTTVTDPEEFLERHVGESLEGAAMLERGARGLLVDLGSGNGYPAISVACVHPALDPLLVEAARDKAVFLAETLANAVGRGEVLNAQVQRPADLGGRGGIRVLTTRAMGNWERILPRFAPALEPRGVILLWAGESVREVAGREAWKRLALVGRHALPGRTRSWIWAFRTSRDA